MSKLLAISLASTLCLLVSNSMIAAQPQLPATGKLKVFILAGQSNMQGSGTLAGPKGTMEAALRDHPDTYGHLVDAQGDHVVRDDVWIVDISKDKRQGYLTTGYGTHRGLIGPEYAFGFAVGDVYQDPVLIIKSAWGGKSLFKDFLPPSAGDYPQPQQAGDSGFYYAEVLRHTAEITADLARYCPPYQDRELEIVGFGWHQGWNDRINQAAVDVYEHNLVHLIGDLRRDLQQPDLLFVIANSGFSGWDVPQRYRAKVEKHVNAQMAIGDVDKYPAFAGNVATVETRDFLRPAEASPGPKQGYHWFRNWETFYLIGDGMGKAMIDLALMQ